MGYSRHRSGSRRGNVHIGIATTVLTLIGLELLSYIFKSVGMKSSMISFSTNNKDTLKQIADRFNSKDYMIVSYEMETQHSGEMEACLLYTSDAADD